MIEVDLMRLTQMTATNSFPKALPNDRRPEWTRDRGAALIITLLLLALMAGLSLVMFLSVFSGSLINGYYRNYRGSFYAADSGANIARQDMVNQILAAAPATYAPGTPPIPASTPGSVQSSVLGTYGAPSSLNAGGASGSWAESFYVKSASLTLAPSSPTVTATDPTTGKPSGYQYVYNYTNQIVGASQGSEQALIQDSGEITINTLEQPAGAATTSFAAWGAFIDQYAPCSGFLVPGLFSGPTFTNGTWNFGPPAYGQYIFTDPIGMAATNASFWFNSGGGWSCQSSPNGSDSYQGQTISPQYQAGYQWGQPAVPLPTNAYSQEQAVLDGIGIAPSTGVSQAQMAATLRDVNGAPYPSSGVPASGVYLPTSTTATSTCSTPPCFTGGGIYVQGTANVQLAATTDTMGNNTETYTISQGGTTTTVVVDNTTNTTTMSSGVTTQVITGVPSQYNSSSGALTGPATMLYVSGGVTGLTGPAGSGNPPPAAIQDGTALTIATPGDVTVTGNVVYKTEPVTTTQNQIPGTPPDTLIPANNKGQVLGIFTANGNINLDQSINGGNIEVDGSLAAISQGGSGGFYNTGACINTFNNIGGQIQNSIYGACMNTENTYFDRRFSSGFAPPWFPSTSVTPSGKTTATYTPSVQRIQWIDLSHM
ncbi:MAG: hypothetical protein ACYDCD_14125 [Candidatus Acidiferrales bacterium]